MPGIRNKTSTQVLHNGDVADALLFVSQRDYIIRTAQEVPVQQN